MNILLTYDISDSKKRLKIVNLLNEFGIRVNYSVFELDIKESILKNLLEKIDELSDKNDSIRVYYFCKDSIEKSYKVKKNKPQPFTKRVSYVS